MLALFGSLIAILAAIAFIAVGLLTLWGGRDTAARELARGFTRSALTAPARALALLLVGAPLVITALFALLAAARILMVAMGLG